MIKNNKNIKKYEINIMIILFAYLVVFVCFILLSFRYWINNKMKHASMVYLNKGVRGE